MVLKCQKAASVEEDRVVQEEEKKWKRQQLSLELNPNGHDNESRIHAVEEEFDFYNGHRLMPCLLHMVR